MSNRSKFENENSCNFTSFRQKETQGSVTLTKRQKIRKFLSENPRAVIFANVNLFPSLLMSSEEVGTGNMVGCVISNFDVFVCVCS